MPRSYLRHVFAFACLAFAWGLLSAQSAPEVVDLQGLDGRRGFEIVGVRGESAASSLAAAGDLNGDGYGDLLVGANVRAVDGTEGVGGAYVVYGRPRFEAVLDLAEIDGTNGFVIDGVPGLRSFHGSSVAGVGDVNGDGLADLAVGAPAFDVDPFGNEGRLYVLYGRPTWPATIQLEDLTAESGFRAAGFVTNHNVGIEIVGAGDVNADGYDDVLVGSERPDPPGQRWTGEAYLIFGGPSLPLDVDLDSLDGVRGVSLTEEEDGAFLSVSLGGAADLNGDGISDFAIGSSGENEAGVRDRGEASVVFGSLDFPKSIDVTRHLDGLRGFNLRGVGEFDSVGFSVGFTDFNGDGFADLLAGAVNLDDDGVNQMGASYLVFGGQSFPPSPHTSVLDGSNGFAITRTPKTSFFYLGASIAGVGDLTADGREELIVASVSGLDDVSDAFVLLGTDESPAVVDLADLDGTNGYVLSGLQGSLITASKIEVVSAGDVDGDGIPDVAFGSSFHSRDGDLRGGAFVVLGRALSGVTLTVTGNCPGLVTRTARGLTPNGSFGLFRAAAAGSSELQGGPCNGTRTDLHKPLFLRQSFADVDGVLTQVIEIGDQSCGDLFQVVDATTCLVSNPTPIQ